MPYRCFCVLMIAVLCCIFSACSWFGGGRDGTSDGGDPGIDLRDPDSSSTVILTRPDNFPIPGTVGLNDIQIRTIPWDDISHSVREKVGSIGATVDGSAVQYDVESYGARGDSSTDNTQAFQQAVDAAHSAGGGVVYIQDGHYLTGPVALKPGVTVQGQSRTGVHIWGTFVATSGPDTNRSLFFTGSSTALSDVSPAVVISDIDSGASRIRVSDPGRFSAGQTCYLYTSEKYNSSYYKNLLTRISQVSGSEIFIDPPYPFAADADQIRIYKTTLAADIHVRDMTLHSANREQNCILLQWVQRCSIRNCSFFGHGDSGFIGVGFNYSREVNVNGNYFEGFYYDGAGYPVYLNGVIDALVENNTIERAETGIASGGGTTTAFRCVYRKNSLNSCVVPIDFHDNVWSSVADSNVAEDCSYGFDMRGHVQAVRNNRFINCGRSIMRRGSAQDSDIYRQEVSGNLFENGGGYLSIAKDLHFCRIYNNIWTGTAGYAITFSAKARIDRSLVCNNRFNDIAGPYFAGYFYAPINSTFAGNVVENCEGFRFAGSESDNMTDNRISDNYGYIVPVGGMIRFSHKPGHNVISSNHVVEGAVIHTGNFDVSACSFKDNWYDGKPDERNEAD